MRYVKTAMRIGQLQTDYLPELNKTVHRINSAFNAHAKPC